MMDTQLAESISGEVHRKKRRKVKKKATVRDEVQLFDQNNKDIQLARNISEWNLIEEGLRINNEVQSVGQPAADIGSSINLTEVNVDQEVLEDGFQTAVHSNMDTGPTGNADEGAVTQKRRKKRKRIVSAESEAELLCELDARTLAEGNLIIQKPKIKDQVQEAGLTKTDTGSTKVPAGGIVNIGNAKIQDETQSMCQTILDTGQAQSVITRSVARKMKNMRKREKAKLEDKVQREMHARSIDNLDEENATIEKTRVKDELQSVGLTESNTGSTENCGDGKFITKPVEAQSMDRSTMDMCQLEENLVQENVARKRRKKRYKKKAKVNDKVHSEIDTGLTELLVEGNSSISKPDIKGVLQSVAQTHTDTVLTDDVAEGNASIEYPKVQDEIQSIEQAHINMTTQAIAERHVMVDGKKKQKRTKKAKVKDEFSGRMDAKSTESLVEVDVKNRISETRDEVSGSLKVMGAGSTENLSKGSLTIENQKNKDEDPSTQKVKINTEPAKDSTKARRRKKKRKSKRKPIMVSEFHANSGKTLSTDHSNFLAAEKVISMNGSCQESNGIILDEGIVHAEVLYRTTAPIVSVRRKLLVLDINGLLADVVYPAPKDRQGDIRFYGRAVFKRPFCDDFLKFCFHNFYVGIWSSRSKKVVDKVVSYLLGDQEDKLIFCWDMDHSTKTGFNTLENRHKPLVCKDLQKIWEEGDPSWPWKKGDYNESNTLLLDDSPYKALLNPLYTSIFPHPYQYSDRNDNSLGPGGDLRVYLEGLAASENVQKYVEQHPFGQSPINEQNRRWEFYDSVLKRIQSVQL